MKSGIKLDSKKILELLEKHIDKLVLGIVAILCIFLLWNFIVGSPYAVEYNRTKHSPGKIDEFINKRAGEIEEKLIATPEPKLYRANKSGEFASKRASTVKIDTTEILDFQPGRGEEVEVEERIYSKPEIPAPTEAVAQNFRTVVQMPKETVNMEKPYETVQTELADVDMVSVQASFAVQTLYANFQQRFAGRFVSKSEWKDEKLATPLFAAVQLERQQRLGDGNWSQWLIVPRGRVEQRRKIFQLPEKIDQVELGGIDLLMLNFDKIEMQRDLLQPLTYEFAASNVKWLPPALHTELIEMLEKEAKLREREGRGRIGNRTSARDSISSNPGAGSNMELVTPRTTRTRERGTTAEIARTAQHVRQDYIYAQIKKTTDLGKMVQPLLVWAHDDTVLPENTYRYRLRVGVFNPTAGKNWFAPEDADAKDDIVLWSEYSPVTEPVDIKPMIYLFPLANVDEKVTIDVAKFYHGNWRTHEFSVGIGETIGKPVKIEDEKEDLSLSIYTSETKEDADIVDFSSAATLVDIEAVPVLAPRQRLYYQVFLTKNGIDITYLPIAKAKWSKQLQAQFNEIEKLQAQDVQVSETRGASRSSYDNTFSPIPGQYFE